MRAARETGPSSRVKGQVLDVVYLCRSGPNEELRYSLRSLRFVEHERVWIFGDPPGWVEGVEVIKIAQGSNKYANAQAALLAICSHPEISESFVLMNDDFFALRPTTVNPLHWGRLDRIVDLYYDARIKESRYMVYMSRTLAALRALKIKRPLCYELHVPMVFEKAKLASIIETSGFGVGLLFRSMYGNVYRIGGERIEDVKVYARGGMLPEFEEWVSSDDVAFDYVREAALEGILGEPGPYERAGSVGRGRTIGVLP